MLSNELITQIKDELTCHNPIYFFHDDPDGVCSFLLFYRVIKEGKGIIVKSNPKVDLKYVRKTKESSPDTIFVLDLAMLDQEYIDEVKTNIVWIDHHEILQRENVKYFNSRMNNNENIPVTRLCYEVVKQDMWIAMVGCIGDWYVPDFLDEFNEKYPDLNKGYTRPQDIYFDTLLGKLVKIFSFVLKGTTLDAMKSVRILTRIKDPYEILNQTTPQGKFLYKRFDKFNKAYESILNEAKLNYDEDNNLLVYIYHEDKMSFTADLANELLYLYPDKIIIIAREKSGEMKMSIRSAKQRINDKLERALVDVEGYGGGHEFACGSCVKKEDFSKFLDNFNCELID